MSDDKKYNGWTNYETWLANLWIGNDEGSYNYWQEQAQDAYDNASPGGLVASFTREDNATADLRDRLKREFDDDAEENGAMPKLTGLYADLLNSALEEVNWHEIAEHFIDNVDKDESQ